MLSDFKMLPEELLSKSIIDGQTCYWRVGDIPKVIKAAEEAGFRNIGGSLHFLIPPDASGRGSTCDVYWVGVSVDADDELSDMSWNKRVELSAGDTFKQFEEIKSQYDFLQEGVSGFQQVEDFKKQGGNLEDIMFFRWSVENEEKFKKEQERRKRPPEQTPRPPPRWP